MKKTIAIFAACVLLASTWFIVAQAPPGFPAPVIATNTATPPTVKPAVGGPPGFPSSVPVTPAAAPSVRTNTPNPMFQSPVRGRTNQPAANPFATNRPAGPGVLPASGAAPQVRPPAFPTLPSGPASGNQATPAVPPPPSMATPPPVRAATGATIPKFPDAVSDDDQAQAATEELATVSFRFQNMAMEQVLKYYADLVGRMIIRSPQVPQNVTIALETQTPLTKSEARQALDTVLALNGYATVPIGEKFITLVPMAAALQEGAAFGTVPSGTLPEAAQFVTQIIKLTNALPSEIVASIQPFSKIPGGIVPIDSSQVIVLRDYAVNVKRMMEMIAKIDVITESAYKLEVIPIKYGKVEDIYNVMSGLIGGGGGAGGTSRATSRRTSSRSSSRLGQTGRTNPNMPGQQIQPQAPAAAQNTFQRNLASIVQRAAGGDSQILGDAKVIPDERANSLVVYADKRDMEVLTNIVAKLDVALAQVLIEAIVMEVSLGTDQTLGVSAVQQPRSSGQFTGAGLMNNGAALPLRGAGSGGALGSLAGTNGTTSLGGSGLTYLAQFGNNFDVLVQAIASDSSVNVVSKPRIQTTHAVPASFFLGDTVPYIQGTYYGSDYGYGGNRSSYQEKEVGINLSVTPYITPDGLVVMEIQQDISSLGTPVKIDNNDVPTTKKRYAESTVSVEDGKTIMLGGYISSVKSKSKSGIPVLKDIPLLGGLFRSKQDKNQRVELMVLMRPTVLHKPQDAALAAENERQRLPGVRQTEREYKEQEQGWLDKERVAAEKAEKARLAEQAKQAEKDKKAAARIKSRK